MKYSKLIFFFALTVLLAFSSCKKEEISTTSEEITNPIDPEITTTNALVTQMQVSTVLTSGLELGCFSVDFPFDLIIDGTTATINNEADFEAVLTDDVLYVDFAYPITITYEDGTTESIADGEAMGEAFASCIPDSGWDDNVFPAFLITSDNSCYDMVYPVNLVDQDGNVSVANDEGQFVDLLANNWDLSFEFPLSILDEDGNTATANDDNELFELLFACEDIGNTGGGGIDPFAECWDYVYPFNMVDQDGNTVVINNHDDICNAMLNGLELEFVFPLTLVNPAGEELVVNNMDELEEVWLDCVFIVDGDLDVLSFLINSNLFANNNCYSINYPLEYTNLTTGQTNTIDDATAAQTYMDNNSNSNTFNDVISFPVTVTELATGNVITIENISAYFEFLTNC